MQLSALFLNGEKWFASGEAIFKGLTNDKVMINKRHDRPGHSAKTY